MACFPCQEGIDSINEVYEYKVMEKPTLAQFPDWMGNLPPSLHSKPLLNLAIPGSHNTFTYCEDTSLPIANDQPDSIQKMDNVCVRKIVYNWSVCQETNVTDQLNAGIRYLDIRVSCPTKTPDEVRIVHGLYGSEITPLLCEILEFLEDHPKEVVLLDFNHFYNFTSEKHTELMGIILSLFDSKLCPFAGKPSEVTLESMWKAGHQVIVFYQMDQRNPFHEAASLPPQYWPSLSITSPWADTDSPKTLLSYLEVAINERKSDKFFVTQGILTPKTSDVIMKFSGSLKNNMAAPMTKELCSWLQAKSRLYPKMNVVMCDFVDLSGFVQIVLAMNQ